MGCRCQAASIGLIATIFNTFHITDRVADTVHLIGWLPRNILRCCDTASQQVVFPSHDENFIVRGKQVSATSGACWRCCRRRWLQLPSLKDRCRSTATGGMSQAMRLQVLSGETVRL